MAYLSYDGSFEGFLSIIFECFARKIYPIDIRIQQEMQSLIFAQTEHIATDTEKSERVWRGLQKKLHTKNKDLPLMAFLSEEDGIEMKLYRFIRRLFENSISIETDYGDPDVLEMKKLKQKVVHDSLRILQFLRFQKTKDDIYFAGIEPHYDVLPFTVNHFTNRFADQKWLIYDIKRDYGIFYDQKTTHEVILSEKTFNTLDGQVSKNILEEQEHTYQTLWKNYFDHINIPERKNLKLQKQHMPRRYWKFLPEKYME